MSKELISKLKKVHANYGIKYTFIANQLNISKNYLSMILHEKEIPSQELQNRIKDYISKFN